MLYYCALRKKNIKTLQINCAYIHTHTHTILGAVLYDFFKMKVKKSQQKLTKMYIVLFSKDALNVSNVTVKTF